MEDTIKGFKKSKLEDIKEEDNEEKLQEGLTETEEQDELSDEKAENLTQEYEFTSFQGSVGFNENDVRDNAFGEFIESDTDNISESSDTEYPTTDRENLTDSDVEEEEESKHQGVSDADLGLVINSSLEHLRKFNMEYALRRDKEEMTETISEVLSDIINGVIEEAASAVSEEAEPETENAEEEIVSKPKRKGPPRVIEDIKVDIDNLSERYSEHGTEFSNPISHLWKKGQAREKLLEKVRRQKNKKVKGESYMSTSPFVLKWIHGFSITVPILNLSKKNKIKIGMASAHSVVVYNYKKKQVRLLQGHRNLVHSISCDLLGRWIASVDSGNDNTVTVWDLKKGIPIKTYFSPHPDGTRLVSFDPTAAYLVTVSFGQQIISVWAWTRNTKSSEASFWLPSKTPPVQRICFSKDNFNYFALLTPSSIITCTYSDKLKKITVFISKLRGMKHVGQLTDIVYVPRTHLIYTPTTQGYVIYWSDQPYHRSFMQLSDVQNKKLQIKRMKLQDGCISVIKFIHTRRRIILTGDVRGRVAFYDITLRILYWCSVCPNEPIVSISFSCNSKLQCAKRNVERIRPSFHVLDRLKPAKKKKQDTDKNITEIIKRGEADTGKFKIRKPPSDASLQRKPFLAMNFMISTSWSRVYYVEYTKCRSEILYQASQVPITAVAAHPYKNYVFFGNADGKLCMYDYINKSLVIETFIKKDFAKDFRKAITSIAVSSMGLELAVGLENGSLHFYDPIKLIKQRFFFHNANGAIRKIIFDKNTNYLVHSDDDMCISLYGLGKIKNYMGKYRSHFEPITDILFTFKTSTLYSIGKDKKLAVYDIPSSFEGSLGLMRVNTLEQFAIPLAMADYEMDSDGTELIIIANDENKFKIYHTVKYCFVKTVLAPILPSPIKFMMILPAYENSPDKTTFMVFGTNNEIGIQMFPVDGNPYKALAYIGSATTLAGISVSNDQGYLFTVSEDDPSMLMWGINKRAVRMSAYYGGEGLHPYYGLLEGGYDGPMLKEMKEFFYYCQIVHDGEYLTGTRQIEDKIHLCDLSNYLNAIGYFPSLKEMNDIMNEIKKGSTKKDSEMLISFEEVVKLYLNHRPAKGMFERDLLEAFRKFAKISGGNSFRIYKNDFLMGLLHQGEHFTSTELDTTIQTLLGKKAPEESSAGVSSFKWQDSYVSDPYYNHILPEFITYEYFLEEILGLDTTRLNSFLEIRQSTESSFVKQRIFRKSYF